MYFYYASCDWWLGCFRLKKTAIRRVAVRETGLSRHLEGANWKPPLKSLWLSRHYRIDGFKGALNWNPFTPRQSFGTAIFISLTQGLLLFVSDFCVLCRYWIYDDIYNVFYLHLLHAVGRIIMLVIFCFTVKLLFGNPKYMLCLG